MNTLHRFLLSVFIIVLMGLSLQSCMDSTGPDESETQPDPYFHNEQPGHAANDFLADSNFTELVVEIDYMEGYEPNAEALDSLEAFLEQRLNKSTITVQEPTEIEPGNQESYTADEIRELEDQHRDTFTETMEDDRLAAYMIIVDGEYEESNVLGIAYYNTSNAFFGAAYDQTSGGVGQSSRFKVEATSYRHEFGHLFGLVNIDGSGTEMQNDHQDEENGHHCDNDECLMYYAMESTDLFGQFVGEEIPSLDQNCILDLQANGGK